MGSEDSYRPPENVSSDFEDSVTADGIGNMNETIEIVTVIPCTSDEIENENDTVDTTTVLTGTY